MEILRQITGVKPDAKYRLRVEFDTGEEVCLMLLHCLVIFVIVA